MSGSGNILDFHTEAGQNLHLGVVEPVQVKIWTPNLLPPNLMPARLFSDIDTTFTLDDRVQFQETL